MKKIIIFVAGALFALSTTVIAATMVFTDQANFDSWYKDAVISMKQKGVINGYPDGSFGPSNNVNRAELAVMLDKFNDHMNKEIEKQFDNNIGKIVDNTLKFSKQEYSWYTNFLVLAESGFRELDGPPQYYGSSDWDEQTANLPQGYKLYTALLAESGNPSYLHFKGEVCEGDVCGQDKDQWYGPFYSE